jgi:hypothetical protein
MNKDILIETLIENTLRYERAEVIDAIRKDKDFILCGTIASGSKIFIRSVVSDLQSEISFMDFDCMQLQNESRFLEVFYSEIIALLKKKKINSEIINEIPVHNLHKNEILSSASKILEILNDHLKLLGEKLVLIFSNCSYIEKWSDKKNRINLINNWRMFLNQINAIDNISYVLVATYGELDELSDIYNPKNVKNIEETTIPLKPLDEKNLKVWLLSLLKSHNIDFKDDSKNDPIESFLRIVDGSFYDSLSLIRRLNVLYLPKNDDSKSVVIDKDKIDNACVEIIKDLSIYFENLLLSLPATQAQLLCSLALEPTDKPHQSKYTTKYGLTSGGSIQSAISSLNRKGLIHKPEHTSDFKYRVSLPLLSIWIRKQRQQEDIY